MKYTVEGNTLTIFLEGDINSSNAEDVESETDKILSDNSFNRVVLDLEQLHYVSSAGLRIIVRIKQRFDDLTLIKTPEPIYEIFEMVGFQNMLKIEK